MWGRAWQSALLLLCTAVCRVPGEAECPSCVASRPAQERPHPTCMAPVRGQHSRHGAVAWQGLPEQLGSRGAAWPWQLLHPGPQGVHPQLAGDDAAHTLTLWHKDCGRPTVLLWWVLQELIDRCNAWPQCQAVVVGPRGWGRFQGMPFGELKGQNDSSLPLNPARGNVNPTTYTLVKTSALPVEEEGGGGLSTGAVAGAPS